MQLNKIKEGNSEDAIDLNKRKTMTKQKQEQIQKTMSENLWVQRLKPGKLRQRKNMWRTNNM